MKREVLEEWDLRAIDAYGRIEETEAKRQEMDWCDAMVTEMQAELGIDPMDGFGGEIDDQDLPF